MKNIALIAMGNMVHYQLKTENAGSAVLHFRTIDPSIIHLGVTKLVGIINIFFIHLQMTIGVPTGVT